jgi:hypothetical protein
MPSKGKRFADALFEGYRAICLTLPRDRKGVSVKVTAHGAVD